MLREFFEKYQIGDAAVAAGVSGGADSLALLFQLDAFLRPQGRRVIALTVACVRNPATRPNMLRNWRPNVKSNTIF